MYAAPELLASTVDCGYSPAPADIWSLGVVMFVMLMGRLPFLEASASTCPRYALFLQNGFHRMFDGAGFSPPAMELLERMLDPRPETRASVRDILQSSWLAQPASAPER